MCSLFYRSIKFARRREKKYLPWIVYSNRLFGNSKNLLSQRLAWRVSRVDRIRSTSNTRISLPISRISWRRFQSTKGLGMTFQQRWESMLSGVSSMSSWTRIGWRRSRRWARDGRRDGRRRGARGRRSMRHSVISDTPSSPWSSTSQQPARFAPPSSCGPLSAG